MPRVSIQQRDLSWDIGSKNYRVLFYKLAILNDCVFWN